MDKDILVSEKAPTTMRQCYSQQQEGIINTLLQSMSLPLAMIGSSFQVHAASRRAKELRVKDSIELTGCKSSCPAPTHPCRDPPKHEDECDGEEYEEEEDCEEECDGDEYREEDGECEEEEEEEDCEDCEEECDGDEYREEEEECEEEKEEEDCVEEEEEEEDCIEEEEEEEEDCIEEEEEEEDCIEEEEEEEDEEDCIEDEEEEEECIEEEPKPKNPPPEKKCQEKETQIKDCIKEKICNGKRQICLEAPKESTKKKQDPKSESKCQTKRQVDSRKGSECKRDCKKYAEKNKETKKEVERKKVAKKDKECCSDFKETRKKKDCSKERKKEKDSKKELSCKKEPKKPTDCYAEDELKKICRKYRDYDCIPPWIEDKPRPRQPNCKCYKSEKQRESGTRQTKDYKTPSSRECNAPEMEDDEDEECDDEEDEPTYHPQKDNCKICEKHFSKEETRYKESNKRDDPVYYFNKKFTDRKLKDWEKCSGDAHNTKNEYRNSRKNLEAYLNLSEQGHLTKRSPYTESNIYLHAPKFETLSGGNGRRSPDIHFHLNTLGTYTRPNVNNNYNGYVVQNEDVYTSLDVYSPHEEDGNYTTDSSNANELCASYTTEANSYHYTVETCSFTRIMDAGGESSDGEIVSSDDEKAIIGLGSSPLRLEHGLSVPSLVSGSEDNERIRLRDLAEFVGADGDKQQRERSKKYERYGQASVGDDDDYYTAHNVAQSREDDGSTDKIPVTSVSLDDQVYTTKVYSPVQRLSRKKSPAPSMFDNEHLIMESMSDGSSESLAESENEMGAIRHTKRSTDSGSFASSLSDFTNSPFENLKRVIASIKKKALGIEDEIQANVVETVQAKGESVKPSLLQTRNEHIQPKVTSLQATVSDVVQSSVPRIRERFCVNVNNDIKKAHRIASFTSVKEKKMPHFLVRSETKAKHFVQLTSQPVTTRHPFQRKYEMTETNSENRPVKPRFLLSKAARAPKECQGSVTADNVINDIVEVLAKPEVQKLKAEPFHEPSQIVLKKAELSSNKGKSLRLSKDIYSAGSREHKVISNTPVQIQTLNYIGKEVKSGKGSSMDRTPSRAQSYSVTSTRTGSTRHYSSKPAFKKSTVEKQLKLTASSKKPAASSSRRSLSAGRRKSADKQIKNNGFLFGKFYQKKEAAELKNASERDTKKMDFIHVTEAIARSLPFFKRTEEKGMTKTINLADQFSPTLDIPGLLESGKIETKKIGFRTFNSVSREKDENTQKFMRRSAMHPDASPKNSFMSKPKKVDVSGDMTKVPFPWQSPRVMEIGPMTNGQKLYDYRKSRKRDNVIISTPPPSPPLTTAPIESHELQEDELDAFHERIISMEMCESAKMIRKKIRQVNYVPDSNIYESTDSSSSDDDECLSVKSSNEDEPVSGSWYCDVPVNIVRTQELYRNQKKTNSIMDEIINLTKQRTLSESIAEYMTESGGEADVQSLKNSEENNAHEASNCDQSNISPKSINSFTENNEEEYCNIYTSDVHVDSKDDLKDSETFLSFNKSMINHIGRILGIRDSNQSNGSEQQREEKRDDECQPVGNEQVTCSFVPAPEQTKDSETRAERTNPNISPLKCQKPADDENNETVVKQCRFNVEPSGAEGTTSSDNIVHVNSSPPRTFPRKMPFQSSANLLLAATNKLARSNSEMYLRMKNQTKSAGEQSPVANAILQKNSPFKSKSVEKNGKPIKNNRQSMSRTAPTPMVLDALNRKAPVSEVSAYNSDLDSSISKRTSIWSKFTRDKSVDSKPKKDVIETDFVKRTASSPDAAAKSRKNYKNPPDKTEKTKSSKSLPQVLSQNKLSAHRGSSPTKTMESNSKVKRHKLSTSTALNIHEKNQDKSAPATSKPVNATGNSPKPSATLLPPSFLQDEPKQIEMVKTSPLKKSVEKRAKSPISSAAKNKSKTLFNKTESTKQSKKDSLKAVSSRSREALKVKSGLDISPKKASIFKSLQEGQKMSSTAEIKSDIILSKKSDKNVTDKNRTERRSRPESYIDWKNKSKLNRVSDGHQAEASNEDKTDTRQEEGSSNHESNFEEKKHAWDRRHVTESRKNLKITPFDNKKLEKKTPSELKKEAEKTSVDTVKEEDTQPIMQQESKPEDLRSITERRLQEVRKKYQPIKEDKVVKSEVLLDEPKVVQSSQEMKQEDFKTASERRMHETRKKYQRHPEEKTSKPEVSQEDSKLSQQTSQSEAEKKPEDNMTQLERMMQELKKKYQRNLEKKFSNTNLAKEEVPQNKPKNQSNKSNTATTGRTSASENRKTKHSSVSESSQIDKSDVHSNQKHFRGLGKTDIFDIPQAAGKRQRKQGKSFRSRSRSRSRTNILSPKMNRKQEAKVPYYPPTILDKDLNGDKSDAPDKVVVDTVKVQEPPPLSRGAAAYKIESSSGKRVNIKKQTTKQPDATSKQQDASILSSAFVAIGDALTALKSSVPSAALSMPDSLSQQIATESDPKQISHKGDEAKKLVKTANERSQGKPAAEVDTSNKGSTHHRTNATDTQPSNKVNRVQSERVIGTYAGPASFSIKRDVTGNNEPVKRHVSVNDLKPAPYKSVLNYDNRADSPVSDNMYYNAGSDYRAYQSETPTPRPISEIPRPLDKEAEESDSQPSSSYKISKQGGTNSVKPIKPSEILPPTILNTSTKQPSPKIPEPVEVAPKNIPVPVPEEKTPAQAEIVDKGSSDTSTFGMISKLINTIKRSAAFEQNFSEKKDTSKNNNSNNNTNPTLDEVLNFVQSSHCLIFHNDILTTSFPDVKESLGSNIKIRTNNSATDVLKAQPTYVSDIMSQWEGPTQDLEMNCNNNADSYIELRKRIRQDRLEHEKKSSSTNDKEIQFSQDSQTEKLSQSSDSKINAQRFQNVQTGLASCCDSDTASFTTLNTLIEWNFILMAVIIALLIGTLVPGSLTNIFACPLPSVYKGLYTYVLGPLGIDMLILKWFAPTKTSVWKSPFAPKEPRTGLFYSFVYQLIVVSAKLILFILNYILIPLLSVPFLVLGPIVSALMNATLCTMGTVAHGLYIFFMSIVGLNVDSSDYSQTKTGPSSQPISSAASSEDSGGEMFNKLNEIQQYASVFVYFGQHNLKKECNYSFLTSFYLWITNQRSPECL
ncbi:hypothetical protein Btru_004117 [Bulinus truncatus]|nr:hypothetical protein Btru_004117 [Bulinus truncatus]